MVYISGEEMTKYCMDLVLERWIAPRVDTSAWEFYDLSCKGRDDTEDQCLHDAVEAGSRIGAIFKGALPLLPSTHSRVSPTRPAQACARTVHVRRRITDCHPRPPCGRADGDANGGAAHLARPKEGLGKPQRRHAPWLEWHHHQPRHGARASCSPESQFNRSRVKG